MIKSVKILFVLVLLIFTVGNSYSQNLSQLADTAKSNSTISASKDQKSDGQETKQPGANSMGNTVQTAKQVRSSRPDMSKARGARPPLIIRPTGAGMPKGAGKPGGAGRHGGR
jgi:hypothetical protein